MSDQPTEGAVLQAADERNQEDVVTEQGGLHGLLEQLQELLLGHRASQDPGTAPPFSESPPSAAVTTADTSPDSSAQATANSGSSAPSPSATSARIPAATAAPVVAIEVASAAPDTAAIGLIHEIDLTPCSRPSAAKKRRAAADGFLHEPLLTSYDLAGIAERIRSGQAKRIILMTGAGISVSAGIPDFRTPGTGLYSRLEQYNLPTPQAVFSIDFFRNVSAKPFFQLAKELFPGNYTPTPSHFFARLLHEKGLLLRVFTQNIDSLEAIAGLPKSKVVAAHGNFDAAHCIECREEYSTEYVKAAVMADELCTCSTCGGLVKPDIVFFGEQLPDRFFKLAVKDMPQCDLLIVMGTSLVVHPFASLVRQVGPKVPRLLINRELVGEHEGYRVPKGRSGGFDFDPDSNYRDAVFLGDCDAGMRQLAQLLGWEQELQAQIAAHAAKL